MIHKIFLVVTFVHWVMTIALEKNFFLISSFDHKLFALVKIGILVIFWQFVAYLIKRYLSETKFRLMINYSIVYFILSLLLLLLIWPGIWYWDEMNILLRAQRFDFIAWQHVLTGVFYLFALTLFPTPVSIILLQIFIISLVVGYFVYTIATVTQKPKISCLAYIPFLLPSVLSQNYLSYRATLFSYLILFFIIHVLFLRWQQNKIRHTSVVCLALITAIITTWRGEGVYFIVAGSAFFIIALWYVSSRIQKSIYLGLSVVCTFTIIGFQNAYWISDEKALNQLVLIINPLKPLVQQAQKDGRTDLLEHVESVLNINEFNVHKTGIRALWDSQLVRPVYYQTETKKLFEAYLKLVAEYPGVFFHERRALYNEGFITGIWSDGIFKNMLDEYAAPVFQNDRFSHFLDRELRTKVLDVLSLQQWPLLQHILYSPLVPVLLLIILGIYALLKKQFVFGFASFLPLPIAGLVFLTAPEPFFMYYLSVYLVGYSLLIGFLLTRLMRAVGENNKF